LQALRSFILRQRSERSTSVVFGEGLEPGSPSGQTWNILHELET